MSFDEKYTTQVGSPLQHRLVCELAQDAGFDSLRDVLAAHFNVSPTKVYKAQMKKITMAEAFKIITALKDGELAKTKIQRLSDVEEEPQCT